LNIFIQTINSTFEQYKIIVVRNSNTKSQIINLLKIRAMSKVNVALGAVTGIAAGALLGVLFAPNKGIDTRKLIVNKSNDAVDSFKNKFSNILHRNGEKVKSEVAHMPEEDDMN
jgi:hypothetical protein